MTSLPDGIKASGNDADQSQNIENKESTFKVKSSKDDINNENTSMTIDEPLNIDNVGQTEPASTTESVEANQTVDSPSKNDNTGENKLNSTNESAVSALQGDVNKEELDSTNESAVSVLQGDVNKEELDSTNESAVSVLQGDSSREADQNDRFYDAESSPSDTKMDNNESLLNQPLEQPKREIFNLNLYLLRYGKPNDKLEVTARFRDDLKIAFSTYEMPLRTKKGTALHMFSLKLDIKRQNSGELSILHENKSYEVTNYRLKLCDFKDYKKERLLSDPRYYSHAFIFDSYFEVGYVKSVPGN